jgi:hypothetical protein
MEWMWVASGVVSAVVFLFILSRLKGASVQIDTTINDVESALKRAGFVLEDKSAGSFMNSSLHMVRSGEPSMGFFLGHKAIYRDRADLKLLGRRDNRMGGLWWLHFGVHLPEGAQFPVFAMRRRHDGTKVAWKYLKPWKWPVVSVTTGDAAFDSQFEILVEEGRHDREVVDADCRAQIMRLSHDPYFNNLIFLVSPHSPGYLMVLNPPLPSAQNPSVEVVSAVADAFRCSPA